MMECSNDMNRGAKTSSEHPSVPFPSDMEDLIQVTAMASSVSSSQQDGSPVALIDEDDGDDEAEEDDEVEKENETCVYTCWDLFKSFYLPLLMQSLFGSFHIFRSFIVGNFIHLQLEGTVVAKKSSSHWPPPALIGLSILTVVALIVHPDGYTWIFLRKVRYVDGFVDSFVVVRYVSTLPCVIG
jgi:hypothetical protein